ncbi:MAG: transposase [Candidatus Dormibacteria bacterium]
MALPVDLDALSPAELKAFVVQLLGKVAALEKTVAGQHDEIARLKGLKGRPQLKPSGMEEASEPKPPSTRDGRRGRGQVTPRVAVEDQVIKATVPPGSRFKGYADFVVQELVLRARCIRYRRERWLTSEGQLIVAPLPGGVDGHFGPELRRFALTQYHQGQVTMPRLAAQLRAVGIAISKRQVMRLLIDSQQRFLDEARGVLRAGLAHAAWITVDDTGARHKAANGTCTQIGNDHFAGFGTTASKSRLNFLKLLRAGHSDYVINAEARAYMRDRALGRPVIEQLATHPEQSFPDEAAWMGHLQRLGFPDLRVSSDPVRIATEGALWGAIKAHGFLPDSVIISDDAGQFRVGDHALCWVHAERLVHKLEAFTDHQRRVQQHLRALIWWFYRDLKVYGQGPTPRRRTELRARFDRIFQRQTGFVVLDRLLIRLRANKSELLRVLERPEIPLHTNGSENDIRCYVTRRKISGGTRSDQGRDSRDAFLGLMKTCQKLGVSFWDYLGARLAIRKAPAVPPLPDLIRTRCATP